MSAVRPVYLALGGNIGDRFENLRAAVRLLARAGRVVAVASLYETPPVGVLDQPPFLNSACAVETALPLPDLLRLTQRIEWEMGRRPARVWGPRPLDIDILLAGDEVTQTPSLEVPHPRFPARGFQIVSLAEIAGPVRHPLLDLTIAELCDALPAEEREGLTRLAGPEWAG